MEPFIEKFEEYSKQSHPKLAKALEKAFEEYAYNGSKAAEKKFLRKIIVPASTAI